ncbi:hypothetical protein [Winogradskyella sp.]|uniref:hypothetical protein n=1 Tax=Winogradskyella sp. TaxID=1883156 RepID=UPI002616407D|nr:hypothetical protein [Winogradskyella sp.]
MINQIRKFTIVILLAFVSNIHSQTVIDLASEYGQMSKNASGKLDAEGSPYIQEDYKSIKIDKYGDIIYSARYNAFNDEIEVKLDDDNILALDNSKDISVTFISDNKVYKTFSYTNEDKISKRGFLVVVEESESYSLLKREYIKYYEGQKAASSYQQAKPATFKREGDTYYAKLDDKIVFIPQKKKSFLKAFPEQSSDLKTYIKENKINLKKETDLKKIIKYLSGL